MLETKGYKNGSLWISAIYNFLHNYMHAQYKYMQHYLATNRSNTAQYSFLYHTAEFLSCQSLLVAQHDGINNAENNVRHPRPYCVQRKGSIP